MATSVVTCRPPANKVTRQLFIERIDPAIDGVEVAVNGFETAIDAFEADSAMSLRPHNGP